MSPRPSNEERAKWRNKCGKVLSKHIGQMRCCGKGTQSLRLPKQTDLDWLSNRHKCILSQASMILTVGRMLTKFFKRNMSDQTTDVDKAPCREVEAKKSVKAVPRARWRSLENGEPVKMKSTRGYGFLRLHSPTDGELSLHGPIVVRVRRRSLHKSRAAPN